MPPHEKEKRFGGEGEKHGFNGIVDDDLSVVHQFGPAGFDAGQRVAGDVQMLISFCTIISSLNSAKLIRRFGTGKLTAISVATTALALLGFSLAKNYAFLMLMAVPLGLGAGAVDAGLNNYVALHC